MRRQLAAIVVGACLVWAAPGRAADVAPTASEFIRQVGHEMPAVLAGAKTIEDKRARLLPFIARVVDVPAVARFCLGRYWERATAEQRQDYQSLFLSVLVNTIATWSGGFGNTGGQVSFAMQRVTAQADGTHVPTTVQTGSAPAAHITWIVNMDVRPPRVLDVVAEGLSLRVTQRSDYLAYLGRHDGDIQAFLGTLRQRAHDASGNPFTSVPPIRPQSP